MIFDYAGVLSHHQSEQHWARLVAAAGVPSEELRRVYWDLRPPYDRGTDDGIAYWRKVGAALGRAWSDAQIEALIGLDTESWVRMNPEVIAQLTALQSRRIPTAILSNMGVDLMRAVVARFAWIARCEVRTFSCAVGLVKPEAAIYERCVAELGVAPGEAIFVDDRHENIVAAERVGLRGVLFADAAGLRAQLRSAASGAEEATP
ncbi:MAG TPA: HAD family phosphatase [Polyangiaceae bacterium]|nr:HAD family phosphatase [Polyangiaceae bacterium]